MHRSILDIDILLKFKDFSKRNIHLFLVELFSKVVRLEIILQLDHLYFYQFISELLKKKQCISFDFTGAIGTKFALV